jgi:murein DD-endopeptidase MepM/ murein hydrolase activator NlpD
VPRRQYHGRHRAPRARRTGATSRHTTLLLAAATGTILFTSTGAAPAAQQPVLDAQHSSVQRSSMQRSLTNDTAAKATGQDVMDRADLQRQASRSARRVASTVTMVRAEQRKEAAQRAEQRKEAARREARARAEAAAARERERREAAHSWVQPVNGMHYTSGFGYRWGRLHAGSDFSVPVGTPVLAMSSGTVTSVSYNATSGNRVEIEYWDGTVSYYFHLSARSAVPGEGVAPGEVVGYSGNTGRSTGPHLHLEIHPGGGAPINPMPWLSAHGLI